MPALERYCGQTIYFSGPTVREKRFSRKPDFLTQTDLFDEES